MNHDIPESVSQGSYGAYDEENRRIQEVSDELQRLCRLYEEEPGNGKANGTRFEILEQERICEAHPATQIMIDTYMSVLGFEKEGKAGRFSNSDFVVWDLVPRNVLVDKDGDMYVVDAEIARK